MTKKLYARNQLAKAARVSGQNISSYLDAIGIQPVEYAVIAGKEYQSYDQKAMDAVVRWRKEMDERKKIGLAPPAAPAPVQAPLITSDVDITRHILTIMSRLDSISKAVDSAAIMAMNTNRKLDELLDSLTAPVVNGAKDDALNSVSKEH